MYFLGNFITVLTKGYRPETLIDVQN